MSYLDAVILGLVQGLTEFLPISSSGHLVIAQRLLGIQEHDIVFDVAAHLGTLMSIVTIYYGLVGRMIRIAFAPKQLISAKTADAHLARMVIVASVPTAVIGFGFKDYFERSFSDMTSLGVCFIFSGLMLLATRLKGGARLTTEQLTSMKGVETITWWGALIVGVAQGVAIMPSISRSGSTIVAGLLLGMPGHTAAMYSFMLSLPAIFGAALLELRHAALDMARVGTLIIGFASAYVAGLAGLWWVISSVRKGRLEIFTVYLVAVGAYILWAWR